MLMKVGMVELTPLQVASIRIISAAVVLLPLAVSACRIYTKKQLGYALLSGLLGSFFPAYLFCFAEMKVDSALAGTLNSLTPVFVIIIGILFYQLPVSLNKWLGVALAFLGSILLLLTRSGFQGFDYPFHVSMIIAGTIFYALNVHLVNKHLKTLNVLKVVSVALTGCSIPALFLLFYTGVPEWSADKSFLLSLGASALLGIAATSLASVLFYKLIRGAGVLFSSMVTYAIPVVANIWGVILGETVGFAEMLCLVLILTGVFLANKSSGSVN